MQDFVLQARKPVWQKQKKGKKGGKKSAKNQKFAGKTIASKKNDDKKSEDKMANATEVSKRTFCVVMVPKRPVFVLSLLTTQMVMEVELINQKVSNSKERFCV